MPKTPHAEFTVELSKFVTERRQPYEIKLLPSEAMFLWDALDHLVYNGVARIDTRSEQREQLRWVQERLARTVTDNPLLRLE